MLLQKILLLLVFIGTNSVEIVRIGGLVHDDDEEVAFRVASNVINARNSGFSFRLVPITSRVRHYNTFNVQKSSCSLLEKGLVGIFGPSSIHSSSFMTSTFDRKEMPHIETHCDPKLVRNNCLLNLHPHPSIFSLAILDIILKYNWKKLMVIYENEESLPRIGPLLSLYADYGFLVTLKQLNADEGNNYRSTLTGIKKTGETNFVLDCSIDVLEKVLKQAQQVGIMTEHYNYIITNLDMQTLDLAQFQYAGTNITGIRIVEPEESNAVVVGREIQAVREEMGLTTSNSTVMLLKTALIIDAVELFYKAVIDLTSLGNFAVNTKPLYCNTTDNWKNGHTIINYMKGKSIKGLTGIVKFDRQGFRSDFTLTVVELLPNGLQKIGTWDPHERLNITQRTVVNEVEVEEGTFVNKTFIIMTCLTPPYAMYKDNTEQLSGNDRFEGFGIDLIQELSNMLGFNYTIEIEETGSNGNQDPVTKEWTGLIGEIIRGRAHLAIADLTVTSDREKYVDFTLQFMTLGIKILYKKPEPAPPSLFLFVSPFSNGVWILLGVSYFFVSMALFIMARMSPSEWTNPYPCVEEPEYLINQFSIRNSLWFTMGSLMQQGTEIAPIGISTRTAAGVWWFFTLIMVSSYTANLAAFLTVETLVSSFNNLEELAEQTEIKYGAKKDGATANYFKNAEEGSSRNKIWKYMVAHEEVMTRDNDEGVRRVEEEKYAFFMESTTIEYVVERHCSLASVGPTIGEKGYAIAMQKNSPYRNILSAAILKLQEIGKLSEIKEKWWKEKCGAGRCEKKQQGEAQPLSLKNAGGVFLVLFVGSILGLTASFIELAYCVHRKSKKSNTPFKEEFLKEMKFFIKFKQHVKTVLEDKISENKLL